MGANAARNGYLRPAHDAREVSHGRVLTFSEARALGLRAAAWLFAVALVLVSVAFATDAYRSGWDAIDWSKRGGAPS